MAVALALTKLRFSQPYKAARTSALALLELVARREAGSEDDSIASVPQAPYASTTMGTQTHPSSLHLVSFSSCCLCSVALAAWPAASPASSKTLELSGDVTDKSIAAGLPKDQLGTRMSAGRVWLWSLVRLLPPSTLTLRWALHATGLSKGVT